MAMKNSNKILNFYKICYKIIKSAEGELFVYRGRKKRNKKDGKGSAFPAGKEMSPEFILFLFQFLYGFLLCCF